tara:strand:- start:5007 stop:6044 length:1038 start_codon:yes stop_codon:yes gene_type:complete
MANSFFKTLTSADRTQSRTLLHENIPITGTLLSGTYNTDSAGREVNIKVFSHGMFQSVYDYPYASSSANHILDLSAGFSTNAASLSSSATNQKSKKVNVYNQLAQVLAGYDTGSNVRNFDADGNFADAGTKHHNALFINFSRLLVKDEIKKGSFSMAIGTGSAYATPFSAMATLTDTGAATSYKSNSPAGEFGIIKNGTDSVGLIYYQAGVLVLTSSAFNNASKLSAAADSTMENFLTSSTVDALSDGIRHRIKNISFNNTTELNSTIFFCRANHNEFNYSSNPTYLSGSKIVVKNDEPLNLPRSYVTTVGLYSPDNELMAVAKVSEPLRKDPTNELTLRVRLDY